MLMLLLMSILSVAFYFVLVVSPAPEEPIKIGVLGPMAWIQGQGIMEGATLAAEEINATGGILGHPVEIIAADTLRGQPIPNATTGIAAAEELIAAGVDFAVGGFNTEAVFGAREVFMNHSCIYFIAGASTDGLVDCAGGSWLLLPNGTIIQRPHCGACVRCNYTRYKYLFRVTPVNSTSLARSLWAFLRFVLEDKLLDLYGVNGKVKVAVVSENLAWADTIHSYMTNPAAYSHPGVLGPYANVTYSARPPWNETDFSEYLTAINASGARLIIHLFSEEAGRHFITQWRDMEVKAVPVGINVLSQESNMWDLTGGNCEYETIMAPGGTRTPITNLSIPFWNAYVARWGHDPIYTSHGPYNSIYALKETIEAYGSWPIDPDTMVPLIEQIDRIGTLGRFRYTGPWNATHKGIYHDVFCNEIGADWTQGYSRPFMVQWKAGEMEVIWPADQPYSKELRVPPWMCIKVPQNYSTIQEAINAAPPGFTICVSSGTYHEAVVINKTLTLIGENRSNTIIDGSGNNYTGAALVTITADDVDISGFTVTNTRLRGINVENSRYCEVHENIVCFTGERGIVFDHGGNNKAYNNVVYNSSAYGAIEAIHSNNNTIYNNLAYFNRWGIATNNGSYNLIYNNTAYSNREYGIHIDWSSTGNIVYNNNFSSNTNHGISVMNQASENIISGNEIAGNNDNGIRLHSSSNNTISGNNITNNNVGVFLSSSSNNTVSGNTITNNPNGVYLSSSSNNNTVSGNTITNNGYGVFLSSSFNTVSGNTITNNDWAGVCLNSSFDNKFYHNNFIDNTQQVYIEPSGYANFWDDGYPSGGNYWSDYNGTDLYHGPYQNETGSDGIGDTPYVIGENNTDRYPLVKPYGVQHDIGITSITPSRTIIGQGYSLHVNIRIVNYGVNAETFNVTLYVNQTSIATLTNITLTSGNSTTVTLTWNTTGVPYGNYTISATATPVPGETDIVDNAYVDGLVLVTVAGDVNADGIVDIFDGVPVAAALGAKLITDPQDPRFAEYWHDETCLRCPHNPLADINQDGVIDGLDLEIVENNYGKTW